MGDPDEKWGASQKQQLNQKIQQAAAQSYQQQATAQSKGYWQHMSYIVKKDFLQIVKEQGIDSKYHEQIAAEMHSSQYYGELETERLCKKFKSRTPLTKVYYGCS